MECEGSHFSTGGHFSPPGLGVMTRYRRKMTPLVVENEPPVTFLRRKMTGGRFSMGVVIRRYTDTLCYGSKQYVMFLSSGMHILKHFYLLTLVSRGTLPSVFGVKC